MEHTARNITASEFDFSSPLLIPLPTPLDAKKTGLKIVEEFEKGNHKITVFRYRVTNYGYTVEPKK